MNTPSSDSTPIREDLTYLWNEYKYRHQLCWQAVYKITAAVIALSIIPYLKSELTASLGTWALVPPVIATLLALFGVGVVNNELRLFAKTKLAYQALQNEFLAKLPIEESVRNYAKDQLTAQNARRTNFDIYAHLLVAVLTLLSFGNVVFLLCYWLPLL